MMLALPFTFEAYAVFVADVFKSAHSSFGFKRIVSFSQLFISFDQIDFQFDLANRPFVFVLLLLLFSKLPLAKPK